jgi:hypothetical protein
MRYFKLKVHYRYLLSFAVPFLIALGIYGYLHEAEASQKAASNLGVDYDPRSGLEVLSSAGQYGVPRAVPWGIAGLGLILVFHLFEKANQRKS